MCTLFIVTTGFILIDGAINLSHALTDAECRVCHTGGAFTSVSERHHSLYVPVEFECSVCHVNAITGCTQCHSPAGHQPDHDKTDVPSPDCSSCHVANVYDEHVTKRNIDCGLCHESTRQEVLSAIEIGQGPSGQTVLCDACHTNAGMHETAHDNVFPDSMDCTAAICHTVNVMTEHTNRGWTCDTCHNAETLTLDPAVILQVIADSAGPYNPETSAYCTNCHGAGAGTHVAEHDQGFFMMTPSNQDCSRCHAATDPGVDPNQARLVEEHVTNQGLTCSTCHNRADHVFDAIDKGREPSNMPVYCVDCHTDATSGQGKGHAPVLVEPWSECSWCHTIDVFGIPEHSMHQAVAQDLQKDCSVCHVPEGTRPDCILCHSLDQTTWDPLPIHRTEPNNSLNIIGPGTEDHDKHTSGIDCSYCHYSGVPGSEPLPAPYNECSKCHDGATATDIIYGSFVHTEKHIVEAEARGQGCSYCHSQAPACTDCHEIAGPNTIRHDTHTDILQYNCTECHINGISGSEPLPEPYDQCSKCHSPAGQPLQGSDITYGSLIHTNIHIVEGEASGQSCDLCHGATPPAPSCSTITCHDIAGPTTPKHDFHTEAPQMINCAECHVSGVPGGTPIPPPYNECSSCHTTINFGQTGHNTHMSQANNNCSRCHTEQPDCSSCHAPGHPPIVAPYNECSVCHDGTNNTTNIMVGEAGHNTHKTEASNNCVVCHTAQPDCTSCHAAGHPPIPAPYNECSSCHTTINFGQTGHITHVTATSSNCVVCHTDQPDCSACHAPGHPSVPAPYDQCDQCHTTLQAGQATHDLHRQRAVQDCTVCHTVQPDCSVCHVPSHPPVPAPYNECDQCHTTLQPGLATHDTHRLQASQNCATCHTAQPDCSACHAPNHPAIPAPYNECDQCHTTLQPGQLTHDTHRLQAGQDCTVCHTAQPNCTQCHTGDANHEEAHDSVGAPSDGCINCHNVNVVVEHVTNRQYTCETCHDSTDQNVINAINAGKAGTFVTCYDCHGENNHHSTAEAQSGNCTQCHYDPRPLDNDPQQLACRECHIDNNGYVQTSAPSPSHAFNTNGNIQDFGACFDCHAPVPYHGKPTSWPGWYEENQQASGRGTFNVFKNELQPNCAGDCEGTLENRSGYGEHSQPESLNDNNWRNPSSFNWFPIVYNGAMMNMPAFDSAQPFPPYPHNRINEVGNCGDCHTVGTVVAVTHNNNCQGCHLSQVETVQNVISHARAGNNVNCFDCHGDQSHDAAHDMTELTDPSCANCHVGNVFTEHVANRQLTCTTCHDSIDPNVMGAITNGKNGVPVPCQDCHGPDVANHEAAHDNAGVPSTGCTNCHDANVVVEHVTNRQFICGTCHDNTTYDAVINAGKAGTFVTCYDCHGENTHHTDTNATSGNCTHCHADPRLDIDPTAPTGQLACRQCHLDNNGYVITGSSKPNHKFNTNGNIQDFGACFDCHQPTPYHAKPTSQPSDCNASTAEAPGKGSFNLFSSEYGGEDGWRSGGGHSRSERSERCDGRESDYRDPAISFNMVTIVDQLGTNRQYSVPTFGSGEGGGSQNDSVNITYASYSSRRDRLTVYAENSLGQNASLSVSYDSENYDMQWDSSDDRWEVLISTSRCRDSSIEVTSSAGGTDTSSVSNCRSY